jgi:hypothetical protein
MMVKGSVRKKRMVMNGETGVDGQWRRRWTGEVVVKRGDDGGEGWQ